MNPKHIFIAVQLIAAVLISSNGNAQKLNDNPDLAAAKKAIAASNAIYFQSFAKNDSSIFIDRYAEDCLILLPNAPAMKGHKGALEFFKMAYTKIGLRNGKFITTDVFGDGKEYVTEQGVWQSFNAAGEMFDNGKFLVLWKKTPKGWKMFRDSFSSDNNK
jgi:ketosteroid isomerase-like protein